MKFRFAFLVLLPLCASMLACSKGGTHYNQRVYAYGTTWEVHLYQGDPNDCKRIADFIATSSRLFDVSEFGSSATGLYGLNQSSDFIEVNPLVYEALEKALRYEEETKGLFNYHLGEVSAIWLDALENETLPAQKDIDEAMARAKTTSVVLQDGKAKRIGEGKIDLNAMAKGFCCEKVKAMLREKNYTKYFVNGGTSSLLIGENTSDRGTTRVAFSDVEATYVDLKNVSVSCSSILRQYIEVEGKLYSHIVNPFTGSVLLNYDSVYLYGEDACLLDAYSTAAIVGDDSFGDLLEEKRVQFAYTKDTKLVYASDDFFN